MTLYLDKHDKMPVIHLIRNVDFLTTAFEADDDDHNRITSNSNIWAIEKVSANYGSGDGWATGTVVVPTTRKSGLYLSPNNDHEPSKDRYDVTDENINGSGLYLVILDLDKVEKRSKMMQTNLPGIAYLDDADYDRMVQALDK